MTEQITKSVIIKGDADKIFRTWTDLEKLPDIIGGIKEVKQLQGDTSHWVVKGPLGKDIQWTAQITRFDQDRRIGWRTLEGDIKTSGQVTFKDLPQGDTEVTVLMQYVPPAGKLGDIAAKLLSNPEEKVNEGLRSFKAYVERMPGRIDDHNK